MFTLDELQAAYPNKQIVFLEGESYFVGDIAKFDHGQEIRLDTLVQTTFLKDEVESEYFHMMLLHRIGEARPFSDEAVKTVIIAHIRAGEETRTESFLQISESSKTVTFSFLAGGEAEPGEPRAAQV